MSRLATSRTNQDDRGAAIVEFALISGILIMLLLGTISAGLTISHNISLNNGAREAARFGATLPVDSDISSWLGNVADVAEQATNGDLGDATPGQSICVAYVYPNGADAHDQTVSITETSGVRSTNVGTSCFADGRPATERRVQISLQRQSDIETGIFSHELTLNATAIVRFDRG